MPQRPWDRLLGPKKKYIILSLGIYFRNKKLIEILFA